jgi:hypothetical protein
MEREKDGAVEDRIGQCMTRTGQGGQSDYRRKGRLYFDTNSATASPSVCKVRKQN